MKTLATLTIGVVLAVQSAVAAAAGAPSAPAAATLAKPLKDLAAADGLQLIGAGDTSDNDKQLHWLTWGERSGQSTVARLALLGHDAKGMVAQTVIERPDAYAPAFSQSLPWRYGQSPVLGWTYMQGASVQTLELYGLDAQRQPVKLDERTGMAISWSINKQGVYLINVYDQDNPRHPALLTPSCYTWQEQSHKLRPISCR